MRRAFSPLLLLALAVSPQLRAQAGLLVPTSTGQPDAKILSLREMAIDVGIARGYARVNVRQVFENHTSSIQEGTYRFALPPSAAVGDFAIWDGLQRIPGVILEKKRARSIYNELAHQRIDPGLLQQGEEEDADGGPRARHARPSGGALFSVTVAPIPPRATKRLELQFQQEVPYTASSGEFRLVLRPPEGEPPVAQHLTVRIRLEDGEFESTSTGLPLTSTAEGATFDRKQVKLDRDLVFRLKPRSSAPLRLTAFRNPEGRLPDGLALAPWERPSEIPPEKDGFFLLEAMPPSHPSPQKASPGSQPRTSSQTLVILFDTSLGHRWSGLELGYGHLMRALSDLRPEDRFAIIPFDRKPAANHTLRPATPRDIEAELNALRNRPLSPGINLPLALTEARKLMGNRGRILLFTNGADSSGSKALKAATGNLPLHIVVTAGEAREALWSASTQVLTPTATSIETDLFFKRLLASDEASSGRSPKDAQGIPFHVSGGQPKLRHIYPVLTQPLEPGALSAWVGHYETPQPDLTFTLLAPQFPGGSASIKASLPSKALEARDLPRRWARARVDDLLARIEQEGERREWVEEIIALSKRYKFITPYTAFLAAPRSLLRPRRIQPGDPVLRVECDSNTIAAKALFPFGLKVDLVRRPASNVWEGRFLVPEGFPDGRYPVRILIRDTSGAMVSETKHIVLDGKAPVIQPELPPSVQSGDVVKIQAKTDEDVVFLSARIGSAPPVPLRWDAGAKRSSGMMRIPEGLSGRQEVLFEAVDGAKNHGFARATLEVRP